MFSIKKTEPTFNSDFEKNLLKQTKQIAKDRIRSKIEAVKCPVHDQTGKATLHEGPRGEITYELEGCCEALDQAVAEQVKEAVRA
jgi:hypothetical protein